jgi:hypothetical protein
MPSEGVWLEPVWAQCLELWKQDLRAMKEGRYIAPMPHPNMFDFGLQQLPVWAE